MDPCDNGTVVKRFELNGKIVSLDERNNANKNFELLKPSDVNS